MWLWESKMRWRVCSWEDSLARGRAKDVLDLPMKMALVWIDTVRHFSVRRTTGIKRIRVWLGQGLGLAIYDHSPSGYLDTRM